MLQGCYSQENTSDSVFLFRYYENFSSPLHHLVRAIATWAFGDRQENELLHIIRIT